MVLPPQSILKGQSVLLILFNLYATMNNSSKSRTLPHCRHRVRSSIIVERGAR